MKNCPNCKFRTIGFKFEVAFEIFDEEKPLWNNGDLWNRSTTSKTRRIRIQPIPGVKIEDLRQIVTDLPHHDLTKVILDAGTKMLLPIHLKAYSKT